MQAITKEVLSHNKMFGGIYDTCFSLTVGLVVDASFLPKGGQLLGGERTNVLCLVVQVEPFPSIIRVHCFVFNTVWKLENLLLLIQVILSGLPNCSFRQND